MTNTTPPAGPTPPADAAPPAGPPERATSAGVTTAGVTTAAARTTRAGLARDRLHWFGSRYALVGVWILMAIIYGIVTPHNFLRISTAQAIFGSQSPLLFLSISALCTFVVGEFDLSFAAVFLGAAVVMPGQFNPIGTLFGIYFLETGIIGLQLLGYSGWVQDAFYGAGLVAAVTVAHLVRNRTRVA